MDLPSASEAQLFREAMSSFPSGATIVTTADRADRWWGFTATSFCSVSMAPRLVLTCLAKSAQCHPAFAAARRWNIHVVHAEHIPLALRFAKRGADKFADAGFEPDGDGLPVLHGASIVLSCSAYAKPDGGDHTILIGQVERTLLGQEIPSVYFRRDFHRLALTGAQSA